MDKKRNYGIDLLRILAMFMVVNLHVWGHGGVLGSLEVGSIRYMAGWLVETAALCAVNVYALISGYVGINSKPRCSRLLMLWLQVAFYTILITFMYTIINPEPVTSEVWKNALFPIFTRQYWYISAYFGLCLLLPVLHWIIEKITVRDAKIMGGVVFLMFSVLPCLLQSDPFFMGNGYSMLWLCMLYVVGACLKKFELFKRCSRQCGLLTYFLVTVISWGSKLVIERIIPRGDGPRYDQMFLSYMSPTMIIAAVSLVVVFSQIQIKNKTAVRVIELVAPLTLGVYIIHEQYFVKNNIIVGISREYGKASNSIFMLLQVIATAGIVFVCCIVIEKLRMTIFKWLHVEEKCRRIDKKIEDLVAK